MNGIREAGSAGACEKAVDGAVWMHRVHAARAAACNWHVNQPPCKVLSIASLASSCNTWCRLYPLISALICRYAVLLPGVCVLQAL